MTWNPPQFPAGKLTLVQAIACVEGYYAKFDERGKPLKSPNRPQRNFNPGNMEYGKFAIAHGATGSDGRFAIFPTEEAGFAAHAALLNTDSYRDLTIEQMVNRFAPPCENNTRGYIAKVCEWTGFTPKQLVRDVL